MILQLSTSIKSLSIIFQILSNNVSDIRLDCFKQDNKNIIKFKAVGFILQKMKYKTEILVSSLNTYNPIDSTELISYEPGDKWVSCCLVHQDRRDIWFPSTFLTILDLFPEEYFIEVSVKDNGKIKVVVKDCIQMMFDEENVVAKFEFNPQPF